MSKVITIDNIYYRKDFPEILNWLQDNVGPVKTWGERMKASGWEMWEVKTNIFFVEQTKIRFSKREDAVLFVLRWS